MDQRTPATAPEEGVTLALEEMRASIGNDNRPGGHADKAFRLKVRQQVAGAERLARRAELAACGQRAQHLLWRDASRPQGADASGLLALRQPGACRIQDERHM